ncbi:MAG: hypothetical protein J6T88_02610 [Bacteroidales bacterium]|nr:hypothetical protein [Bacteroidales bacterium]
MSATKYICLRDDDTNFFTSVEELQTAYGPYWGTIPITLAVIPFAHGSERKILDVEIPYEKKFENLRRWEVEASEKELSEYHKVHPVGENKELIQELKYLASTGKIEIAQHGVFHRYTEFGAELLGDRMSFTSLRDGKEYLEKVFDVKVKTLIPPGNVIDLTVIDYMNRLGMHLFSSGRIRAKNRWETIKTYFQYPESYIDKRKKTPHPMHHRYGIHYFGSHTFEDGCKVEQIMKDIKNDLYTCGFSALGTHYRYLNDENNRATYHFLIDSIAKIENIQFVTASDYYNKALETKQ